MTDAMLKCIAFDKKARHQIKREVMHPTCHNNRRLRKQLHYAINRVESLKVAKMKIRKNKKGINDAE
jgi:hypothetical protein